MIPGSRKKRNSQLVSRNTPSASAASTTDKYNNRNNINFVALSSEEENDKFTLCEVEQTLEDRFWGLENESARQLREQGKMFAEDNRSRIVEESANFLHQKKRWESEFESIKISEAYDKALLEERERENYMKHFYTAMSSVQIMDYKWQSKPTVDPIDASFDFGYNEVSPGEVGDREGAKKTIPFHAGGAILSGGLKHKEQRKGLNNSNNKGGAKSSPGRRETQTNNTSAPQGDFQLPSSNSTSVIVHLDGIQQSRALTLLQNAPVDTTVMPKRGPILHSRSSYHIAEIALQPETINVGSGGSSSGLAAGKKKASKNNRSMLIEKVLSELEVPREPGHIDSIDGHVQYKWDQELCLRIAFAKLCTSSSGRLSIKDIKRISHMKEIHELLKFTVFGSKIKRKRWEFFMLMFGMGDHAKDYISLIDWMQAAKALSTENTVHELHIRTNEEHLTEVFARDPLADPLRSTGGSRKFNADTNNFAYYFANKSRSALDSVERSHRLYRSLSVGDCVWGLHDGGVTWLPAVITNIDNKSGDISSQGVATYDLQYTLTARHLNQAKVNAASRVFVTLPSQVDDLKSKFAHISNERKLCESVFDIIDMNGAGVLPLSSVLKFLDNGGIREIVLASGVLSVIVGLRSLTTDENNSLPPLIRSAIVALFDGNSSNNNNGNNGNNNSNNNSSSSSNSNNSNNSSHVMISKDDFRTIINVVLEISQYKYIFSSEGTKK